MRRLLIVLCALLGLGALINEGLAARQAPRRISVVGVWTIAEQWSRSSGGEWTARAVPNASLYIFTEAHYSYMDVPGAEPRRRFTGDPNGPTDAEKVAAYHSFVAGSGRYTLTGSILTLQALVHKNPNEMAGEPLVYDVDIGASTLRMTIVSPAIRTGSGKTHRAGPRRIGAL
jgi:hypothetical protein